MSESLDDAPGEVFSETEHATTYKGATAISFEGKNRHLPDVAMLSGWTRMPEMFSAESNNTGAVR